MSGVAGAPDVPVPNNGTTTGTSKFPDSVSVPGSEPLVGGKKVTSISHELLTSNEIGHVCV